jgi:N-acetylneuraminic acid mutarotase
MYSFKPHKNNGSHDAVIMEMNDWSFVSDLPYSICTPKVAKYGKYMIVVGGVKNDPKSVILVKDMSVEDSTFVEVKTLNTHITFFQLLILNNKMYIIGGIEDGVISDLVRCCKLDENGTPISPLVIVSKLPTPLSSTQSVIFKNKCYLLGGQNKTNTSGAILVADIDSKSNIYKFTKIGNMAKPVSNFQAITSRHDIKCLGGFNGLNFTDTIVTLSMKNGLVAKECHACKLFTKLRNMQVITTKNKVIVIGGYDEEVNTSIYVADIVGYGEIGEFSKIGEVPFIPVYHQVFVTENFLYAISGENLGEINKLYRHEFDGWE